MELGIQGLRVLVTAGASGIGLEAARAFVREGAKVHVCDVDRRRSTRWRRAIRRSPARSPTSSDRARRGAAVRGGAQSARRARCLDQQRRHRGPDRPGRGDSAGGMGPLPGGRPHRPVQLRAARGPASAQKRERLDHQPLVGRGPARLRAARAVCGGEMGRGRLHQVAGRRAWAGRHPGQRHPARRGRGRAHPPGVREQGAGARHVREARCRTRPCPMSRSRPRSRRSSSPTPCCSCARRAAAPSRARRSPICGDLQMLA